jgi:hypothetical protein
MDEKPILYNHGPDVLPLGRIVQNELWLILQLLSNLEKRISHNCRVYLSMSFSGDLLIQVYFDDGWRCQRQIPEIELRQIKHPDAEVFLNMFVKEVNDMYKNKRNNVNIQSANCNE